MERIITFREAMKEAFDTALLDKKVFIIGEGVPDPKGIFGTTTGLKEKYPGQVMDMPLSENGMTGICIGAALTGMRPVLMHQRIDFALLSLDQLFNNAAKWHYTFGGQQKVPMVVRMVIGRGWGQGPNHSQNIQNLFAHIPGLKVVMPSTAYSAKGLMLASIKDNNPVMFIEHRWLHNLTSHVPQEPYEIELGKCSVMREGSDLTIVSTSFMTLEAMKLSKIMSELGINIEVIDVQTIKPLDKETILKSVKKTGKLLVMDTGYMTGGFASDVTAMVSEEAFSCLRSPPKRITLPDIPTPCTKGLTKHYYPNHRTIAQEIINIIGDSSKEDEIMAKIKLPEKHDIPDSSFTGPF